MTAISNNAISEYAIAPCHASDLPKLQKELEVRPLTAATAGVRLNVWRVWSVYQYLFPSPLPLAAMLGVWVREYGLTEDDANRILADLLSPDSVVLTA